MTLSLSARPLDRPATQPQPAQLDATRAGRHTASVRTGRRIPLWFAVAMAVGCGALMATQAKVNGELGARLENGFAAAVISFGSGLAALVVLVSALPAGRRGIRTLVTSVRRGETAWWALTGGCGGAILVLSQSLTTPLLGVAVLSIAVIGGQTMSGLILDRFGLAPGGRRPLTVSRVGGAIITLIAVAVTLSSHVSSTVPLLLLMLPLAAGLAIAWQQAVNGRVTVASASALTSTFVNFWVGTLALLIAYAASTTVKAPPVEYPTDWWLYSGGMIGVAFIFGLAAAVQVTGVLLLGLATIAGQLSASILWDTVTHPVGAVGGGTVISTLVVFAAVLLAAPRPARRTRQLSSR
jgi:transporter family-2 protein